MEMVLIANINHQSTILQFDHLVYIFQKVHSQENMLKSSKTCGG